MYNRNPYLIKAAATLLAMMSFLSAAVYLSGGRSLSARGAAGAPTPNVPGSPSSLPPTTVTKDEDGYTLWTVDWGNQSWCAPVSTLRYPFDLMGQDPSELNDATLRLTFNEGAFHYVDVGNGVYVPQWKDASWGVALNGKPPTDWQIVDAIGALPTGEKRLTTKSIPLDPTRLIDGENNIWLQQHDLCPQEPGCATCACTCVELAQVQLRAGVLQIKSVSPEDGTRNVWSEQSQDSEIRVKFTTVVSSTTVTPDTFQVYYFDQDVNKVYVDGDVSQVSSTEYAFTPKQSLMDGVQYIAQVWGKTEAEADSRDEWVKNPIGGPLENGRTWVFWTIPQIQVKLAPVQVLEGMALVQDKPTVLRTFIRWDTHTSVFWKSNVPDVLIDDVVVSWLPPGGTVWLQYSWSIDANWVPALNAKTARHKREYRQVTFPEESYSLLEKRLLYDSFNFFGFTPREMGVYQFKVDVIVKDSLGKEHHFPDSAQGSVFVENTTFPVYMQAVAVGSAYGRTGTVDLSALVQSNLGRVAAMYPVANVNWPAAPSAMAYYSPTTTGWTVEWVNPPSWPYYPSELYLLREMNQLCIRTTGCRAMVGVAPQNWLHVPGTSLRESAPLGALVRADMWWEAKRYTTAHEIAHLAQIDEHYEGPSGNGFDVGEPAVRNVEQGYTDFMSKYPEEENGKILWTNNQHYTTLWQWIHGGIPP